jgi:hypothetical protein
MTSLVLLCSLLGNETHQLDPAQANDHVAPSAVTASAEVVRFDGSDDGGCAAGGGGTCGDLAEIELAVSATDDATPADKVGYVVELASGTPPRGFALPAGAILPAEDSLLLRFSADDHDGFTIDLSVRAIDLNGNLGPPTVITVSEPGESGCRTARGGGALLWPLLAAFAWLVRPARARATR